MFIYCGDMMDTYINSLRVKINTNNDEYKSKYSLLVVYNNTKEQHYLSISDSSITNCIFYWGYVNRACCYDKNILNIVDILLNSLFISIPKNNGRI